MFGERPASSFVPRRPDTGLGREDFEEGWPIEPQKAPCATSLLPGSRLTSTKATGVTAVDTCKRGPVANRS